MARTQVATADFDGADAALGSDWTHQNGFIASVMQTSSNRLRGGTAGFSDPAAQAAAFWNADSFDDDQFSALEVVGLGFVSDQYTIGVTVRASGADPTEGTNNRNFYYALVCADSSGPNYTVKFGKVVAGSHTPFNSASMAFEVGDTIEIEAEGTTVRLLKNGVALGGSWTVTDSALASGSAGVMGAGDGAFGDNWEAGNISSAASVGLLAQMHHYYS